MNQVSIRRFLDKPNSKSTQNNEDSSTIKRQNILRKMVKDSVKKYKLHTVRKIVKKHDETKPWGSANHVKVCKYFVCHGKPLFYRFPLNHSAFISYDNLINVCSLSKGGESFDSFIAPVCLYTTPS